VERVDRLPARPAPDKVREMPSSHERQVACEETALWALHFANEPEFPARDGLVEAAGVLGQWIPGGGIGVRTRASADGSELTLSASAAKGVWVTQRL